MIIFPAAIAFVLLGLLTRGPLDATSGRAAAGDGAHGRREN